jgi:hypothetical protein
MAQAIHNNITSKFHNLSNEALADAIGNADLALKAHEAEVKAQHGAGSAAQLRSHRAGTRCGFRNNGPGSAFGRTRSPRQCPQGRPARHRHGDY